MTRKVRKDAVPTEDMEQIRLSAWLTKEGIRHFAVPNGGKRHLYEAIKLKRMGVSPGVPDICIPVPSRNYHGLFVEMKRSEGGVVSDAQADWIRWLNAMGYLAVVAKGFDEAQEVVIWYLDDGNQG